MITGLGEDTTRRFLLKVTLLPGSSRVLMGAAHRGIDAQIPHDRTLRISQVLEPAEDPVPGAVSLPSAEQVVDPAPRAVLDGHVPPRNARSDPEPYAVDQLPPGPDRRPPRLRPQRRMLADPTKGVGMSDSATQDEAHWIMVVGGEPVGRLCETTVDQPWIRCRFEPRDYWPNRANDTKAALPRLRA